MYESEYMLHIYINRYTYIYISNIYLYIYRNIYLYTLYIYTHTSTIRLVGGKKSQDEL